MKLNKLYRRQYLPLSLADCWEFFSNPYNLTQITPDWLHFKIVTDPPETVYPGMLIEYEITLPPGIPQDWVTEITHVEAPYLFVDEQRFGPYKLWHHQHMFHEVPGGVEMEDIVHYVLPFGFLGQFVHSLWVKRQLQDIFDYRFQHLLQRFGLPPSNLPASPSQPAQDSVPQPYRHQTLNSKEAKPAPKSEAKLRVFSFSPQSKQQGSP